MFACHVSSTDVIFYISCILEVPSIYDESINYRCFVLTRRYDRTISNSSELFVNLFFSFWPIHLTSTVDDVDLVSLPTTERYWITKKKNINNSEANSFLGKMLLFFHFLRLKSRRKQAAYLRRHLPFISGIVTLAAQTSGTRNVKHLQVLHSETSRGGPWRLEILDMCSSARTEMYVIYIYINEQVSDESLQQCLSLGCFFVSLIKSS